MLKNKNQTAPASAIHTHHAITSFLLKRVTSIHMMRHPAPERRSYCAQYSNFRPCARKNPVFRWMAVRPPNEITRDGMLLSSIAAVNCSNFTIGKIFEGALVANGTPCSCRLPRVLIPLRIQVMPLAGRAAGGGDDRHRVVVDP